MKIVQCTVSCADDSDYIWAKIKNHAIFAKNSRCSSATKEDDHIGVQYYTLPFLNETRKVSISIDFLSDLCARFASISIEFLV